MSSNETIECTVDRTWFCWKRWVPIAVMCFAFGAYFLYDGISGYPKKNEVRKAYDQYVAEHDGKDDGWDEYAFDQGKGWPGRDDIPKLADGQEAPHTQEQIDGQFHWAYGCFALGAAALLNIGVKVGRKLRADGEAFFTPKGIRVPYSSIYRLDKRKWNNKGLATVYYRDGDDEKKTTLDVLMFPKAEDVMSRVQANFHGELIERIEEDEEDEQGEGQEGVGEGVGEGEEKESHHQVDGRDKASKREESAAEEQRG